MTECELNCIYNYFPEMQKKKILPLNKMPGKSLIKEELSPGPQRTSLIWIYNSKKRQVSETGGTSEGKQRGGAAVFRMRSKGTICIKARWRIRLESSEGSN